ncbi:PREDICTED: apolipoprotein L3-like [Chrysochloris asiatica]|uniref:Apolipoprotein L3-like n=1 Tax=Chrysochloris asiatica TaxID=185453 RepID=A0A9B0UDJ3_CHRAS|nr:PREDICTED: apolipoprotein L3-like [Chrysochloris asiatica]
MVMNEADGLHEVLKKLSTDMVTEEKERLQEEIGKFVKEFPGMKSELEECIRKLHVLAKHVGKVHKDCTISNIVVESTNIVSGVLFFLGLFLAPVSAGFSMGLSAAGIGLGAVANVTGITTTIVDESSKLSAKYEAKQLLSSGLSTLETVEALCKKIPRALSVTKKYVKSWDVIAKHIHAIKVARINPLLVDQARHHTTTGNISIQSKKQVQETFKGTALAMTKGARLMGMATTGVSILSGVISLVTESKHLWEGANEELANTLKQLADELEKQLEKLTQKHQSLQSEMTP